MTDRQFDNPFRPGAGQMPPHLAGRDAAIDEFRILIDQDTILENLVLTGLRGVGKTVLLEHFRPIAIQSGWWWTGTDLSESASVSEEMVALRLLTDVSLVTSVIVVGQEEVEGMGFRAESKVVQQRLDYDALVVRYKRTPGLVADKLKYVLEEVWARLSSMNVRGLIFAYDEAQQMSDRPGSEQYPLALLLDVFQSIQRKGIPFMLALTGLPTLFPKLVEARTYAERMFRVVFLDRLSDEASRDAILKPIQDVRCPITLSPPYIEDVVRASAGYPYFIQFICREVYDAALRKSSARQSLDVPMDGILRKLDTDFFAGRWGRATDRQRDLLWIIANLDHPDDEFTVQEVVELSQKLSGKPFSSSHVNQMLATLSNSGLVYKNRHGKYSFAVPLFGQFILREVNSVPLDDHDAGV